MKVCDCCNRELPLEDFGIRRANQDGLNNKCKLCISITDKMNREEFNCNFRYAELKRKYEDLQAKHRLKCKMHNNALKVIQNLK